MVAGLKLDELEILAFKGAETLNSEELFQLLFDEDNIVRTIVAKVLQLRGDPQLFERILDLASHQDAYVRDLCAFLLGQYGTPEKSYRELSINTLLKLIKDNNYEVRAGAAAALGHLYYKDMPPLVEEALFKAASDKSATVRLSVACALGSCANVKKAEKLLVTMLNDKSQNVAEWAEVGLDILLYD